MEFAVLGLFCGILILCIVCNVSLYMHYWQVS